MDVPKEGAGEVRVGATYEHYKGKQYRVIALGRDSGTLAPSVIYRGLYNSEEFGDQPVWVRPLTEFTEEIEVAGEKQPRFVLIEEV